jgi:hypothetical protein
VTLYSVVDHYQYFGVEEKVAGSSKTWVLAEGTSQAFAPSLDFDGGGIKIWKKRKCGKN